MEEWRNIEGYSDYMVSNLGRVKSLKYNKEKILKPATHTKGYLCVALCKNSKMQTFKVHRLVAQAFIPNTDNLPQVNHINEDKSDNRVDNLEWCDASYNINYGTGIQRRSTTNTNGKRAKTVYQYTIDGEFVAEYPSVNEIERQLGYRIGNIWSCCNGRYKSAYGYKWSYNLY